MNPKLVIDQLGVDLDGIPGLDPERFRTALVRALGTMTLPEGLAPGRLARLDLPAVEARPGESEERLAARTAEGLARAIRKDGP